MPVVSLGAFLKIVTKTTPQKASLYGRYLMPGNGYAGFYKPLHDAAYSLTVGGANFDEIKQAIENLPREAERKHNVAAVMNLNRWIKKFKPTDFFDAPRGIVKSPGGHLAVRLEPEFGAVLSGTPRLLQVWYAKDLNLSKTAIGVGERLIEKHLCVGKFSSCKAGILDLRRKEVLDHSSDDQAMDILIAGEFAWADAFFQTKKDESAKTAA
jgi:hypothetical protein